MNIFGKGLRCIMKRLCNIFSGAREISSNYGIALDGEEAELIERACDFLSDHPSPDLGDLISDLQVQPRDLISDLQVQPKIRRIYYLSRHARKFRARKKNQKRLNRLNR